MTTRQHSPSLAKKLFQFRVDGDSKPECFFQYVKRDVSLGDEFREPGLVPECDAQPADSYGDTEGNREARYGHR